MPEQNKPQIVTKKTEEKEQVNNTNLGLQMTGLQTEEGKTVQNLGEYADEVAKAEAKKAKEEEK